MKPPKKNLDTIRPHRSYGEENSDAYYFSFEYLEQGGNQASNKMLQELRKISEGNIEDITYKHIAQRTKNREYEVLYENLENKGVPRDAIYEIRIQKVPHRIFFFKIRYENSTIISVIKMTTKHLKY